MLDVAGRRYSFTKLFSQIRISATFPMAFDVPSCGLRCDFPESKGTGHEYSAWCYVGNRPVPNSGATGEPLKQNLMDIHHHNSRSIDPAVSDKGGRQGTHTTRFHRGFVRRTEISSDRPRLQHSKVLAQRASVSEQQRRENLGALQNYNHFNVITGAFRQPKTRSLDGTHSYDACFVSTSKATRMHPQMHTRSGPDDACEGMFTETNGERPVAFREYPGSRLPATVAKTGRHALAQSHARFFKPLPSGDKQDLRQTALVTSGGGPSHPRAAGGGNGMERKRVR